MWRLCALATLAVSAVGCGGDSDKVKTYAVRGQVLVDGKPAANARLVLFPSGGEAQAHKLTPRATTANDGTYALKTYWSGDGAPVGDYKVIVVWKGPLPAGADSEDFSMSTYEDQPDRLKGKYEDPERSPLRITIQGAGDLAPLELTTR